MASSDDPQTASPGNAPLVRLKLDQIQTHADGSRSLPDAEGHNQAAHLEGTPHLVLDEVFGRSLRFSGAEDAVVMDLSGMASAAQDSGFTLAIWIKPGHANADEPTTVVSMAGGSSYWWALRVSDTVEFLWRSNRPQPSPGTDRSGIASEPSWNTLASPEALAIDEWTQVTVSATVDEVRLFINGTRVNEAACDEGLSWSSHGPVVLGHNEQLQTKLFGLQRIIGPLDEADIRKFVPDDDERNSIVERLQTEVRAVFAKEGYSDPSLVVNTAGGGWSRLWNGEVVELSSSLLSLYVLPEGAMTGGETGPGYEGTIREGLSQLPEIDGPCHHIAFDGTSVWAFGTDSDVIGLDEEDGEPVPWNIGPAASLAFDRVSGSFLVARDGNVFSYEFKDGLPRPLIAPDYRPLAIEHDAPVISIVTPENNLRTQAGQAVGWATACEDGTVHLWGWNLNSHGHHHGLPQPLQDERGHPIVLHHDGIRALAFSENGRMLVTGSESGEARLWETTTGKAVCDPKGFEVVITHDAAISAVTFGSGGRLVAGERVPVTNVVTAGAGGTVRVWDVEALQGPHQRFQGDLSNVRLYPQALKQDEIEAAILKDLPEIQVGTIFPLDFSLHNDQQQHVLYLTDEPQQLHLDITNVGRRNVMLPSGKGKANDEGHSAAPTESTLEIRFRPGTLKPESRIALSTPDVDHAQKLGHIDDSANWALRQTRDADGTDVIHLLRKSAASNAGNGTADAAATLLPGETLYLTLGGVLANVSLGTHSTRVQLKYRLHYDQDTPLSGSRLHYLRVLNMSDSRLQTNLEDLLGKSVTVQASLESVKGGQTTLAGRVAALESNLEITKKIEQTEYLLELGQYFEHGGPLVAGIVGVPAVINDGTSNNRLQLRIDNRNTEPGHAAALNSDHSPIFRVYLYHFSNLDWSLLSSGDLDSVSKLTVFELPVAVEHPKEGEPKESEFPRVSDHWQARKVVEDHLAYIEITRKVGVGDSEKFQGLDLILEDFTCSADDRANRSAAEKPQTGTAYVNIWYQHVGVGEDQNKSNLEGWLRVPVERSPILPHGDSTLVSRSLSLIDNAYLGFHHQDVQRGFDPGTPDSAVSIDANGALQIASKDAIGLYPGAQPTGASVPQGTRGLVLKNDGEGVQVALDGGLQATGDIDAVGAISAASLTVKGDITVEGKVGPQDGLGSYLVPRGAIIMWNGDPRTNIQTPPDGWVLCDGKNGTPDLRSRFIISAGPGDASNELSAYSRGNTGGQEQVRLTEPQLPGHVHYGATAKDGAHQHLSQRTSRADNDDNDTPGNFMGDPNREYYSSYDVGRVTQTGSEHSHGFKTESTGGSGEHENRPPYYALYYIMKL